MRHNGSMRAREKKREQYRRWYKKASKRRVLDEVAKCDVVCSNCHRERTHRRRKP